MNRKTLLGALSTTVGGIFLFAGIAFAQTAPLLTIGLDVSPHIIPGTRGTVALVKLDASNSMANVHIPSLTFSSSFAGGAGQNTLTNCAVSFTNAIGIALNTNSNAVSSLGNTTAFTFDTPVIVPAGGTTWLGLVCNVDASLAQNGAVTLRINPATVSAINASTSAVIIPTAGVSSAGVELTSGTASAATLPPATQGTTPSTQGSTQGTATTPGIPNTGAGGNAASNIILLIISGIIIATGATLLFSRPSNA
jgi:hypothetical protein